MMKVVEVRKGERKIDTESKKGRLIRKEKEVLESNRVHKKVID